MGGGVDAACDSKDVKAFFLIYLELSSALASPLYFSPAADDSLRQVVSSLCTPHERHRKHGDARQKQTQPDL
ncbi:hypothetical protein Bpfe_028611, partial [Biomphalaria pfeifferi]